MSDEHPELNEYEPYEGKPLRSRHTTLVMRIVVVLALVALVVPGVAAPLSIASATAETACADWVANEIDGASGSDARFELFGAGGLGWECYSAGAFGGDRHVASLGLIPARPQLPAGPPVDS